MPKSFILPMNQLLNLALAMFSQVGMLGGIVSLGIIGLTSDPLSKYGLTTLLKTILRTVFSTRW